MTGNIYPSYQELGKGSVIIARRAIIRAYEQTGNVSEVARMFRTTRKGSLPTG